MAGLHHFKSTLPFGGPFSSPIILTEKNNAACGITCPVKTTETIIVNGFRRAPTKRIRGSENGTELPDGSEDLKPNNGK